MDQREHNHAVHPGRGARVTQPAVTADEAGAPRRRFHGLQQRRHDLVMQVLDRRQVHETWRAGQAADSPVIFPDCSWSRPTCAAMRKPRNRAVAAQRKRRCLIQLRQHMEGAPRSRLHALRLSISPGRARMSRPDAGARYISLANPSPLVWMMPPSSVVPSSRRHRRIDVPLGVHVGQHANGPQRVAARQQPRSIQAERLAPIPVERGKIKQVEGCECSWLRPRCSRSR